MKRIQSFMVTSLLGGVMVISPVVILIIVFRWMFSLVAGVIEPLTDLLIARSEFRVLIAQILVMVLILAACFLVGVFVRTRLGKYFYGLVDQKLFRVIPGYKLVKETVLHLLGSKKSIFSQVVLARIFGNETLVTGFVTDVSAEGIHTVFVPTGPNPTSGIMYHLKAEYIHPVDASVEEAMQSIIGCGAGSSKFLDRIKK